MIKIGMLGGTSHIAKGLVSEFGKDPGIRMILYSRTPDELHTGLRALQVGRAGSFETKPAGTFGEDSLDVVINLIGAGDPARVKSLGADILRLTEEWDNRTLDYLAQRPQALYVFLSSGAIYGAGHTGPVNASSVARIAPNELGPKDFYTVAKLNAEAKHRGAPRTNIVDIRVFGYFSRYIDIQGGFFLAELARSIRFGHPFVTTKEDMIRDYADPEHLGTLIRRCIEKGVMNAALDLYTQAPIGKFELLAKVSQRFGLTYRVSDSVDYQSPTGTKPSYCTEHRAAADLGYVPRCTSEEIVLRELAAIRNAPA